MLFTKIYIHYLSDNPLTDQTPWVKEYRNEISTINSKYKPQITAMLDSMKMNEQDIWHWFTWKKDENYGAIYYDNKKIKTLRKDDGIEAPYRVNGNFYWIWIWNGGFYHSQILFNLDTKEIFELDWGRIQEAQKWTLGMYINQSYPTNGIKLIEKNGNKKTIFVIESSNQLESTILDFELLVNKQIKVTYLDWEDWIEKQEIINLD